MQLIKFIVAAVAPLVLAAPSISVKERAAFTGKLTWYDAEGGLGSPAACGDINQSTEFIVAMNYLQFGDNPDSDQSPVCHKKIRIHYGDKQHDAGITDECLSCAYGDIDGTKAVFQDLVGDLNIGEATVIWEFI